MWESVLEPSLERVEKKEEGKESKKKRWEEGWGKKRRVLRGHLRKAVENSAFVLCYNTKCTSTWDKEPMQCYPKIFCCFEKQRNWFLIQNYYWLNKEQSKNKIPKVFQYSKWIHKVKHTLLIWVSPKFSSTVLHKLVLAGLRDLEPWHFKSDFDTSLEVESFCPLTPSGGNMYSLLFSTVI